MSFGHIRKPAKPIGEEKPKFAFNGICSADTTFEVDVDGTKKTFKHDQVDKIVSRLCKEKFGKDIPKNMLTNFLYNVASAQVGTRSPKINKDGDYYDGYDENTMFFAVNTKVEDAPNGILIVDQKRNPLSATSGHPVNGDYVNVVIDAYAYEFKGKKGISGSFGAVQYLRKGEPFGSSAAVEATAFDEELMEEGDDSSTDGDIDPDDVI